MEPVLSVESVSHSFGDHQVLDDVCLSLRGGEILGLLGPSGAGKTTLVKILTGQLRQTGGRAQLLGCDTRELGDEQYLSIGSMMDNLGLYERLSVEDNLRFFAEVYGLPGECVNRALAEVGLTDARKTAVERLSKGMKNRLSLARALLNHPKVLFLDEPTSGLDPATTRDIHALLRARQADGSAIFLTTHNMQEAQDLCDTVALLCSGRIVEMGSPAEICRRHDHLHHLDIVRVDGSHETLPCDRRAAGEVAMLLSHDELASIHSTEPNLEDVFLQITGKELSDVETCARSL